MVARSPYPWLLALHAKSYEVRSEKSEPRPGSRLEPRTPQLPFSVWLRRRVVDQNRVYMAESRGSRPDYKGSPVELWSAKVSSYLAIRGPKVLLNRDDLYSQQALSRRLFRALERWGFVPCRDGWNASSPFPLAAHHADKPWDKLRGQFSQRGFDAAAVADEPRRWLPRFSQSDLDYVNAGLARGVLDAFRIERVTAAAADG
jgi:hypothetical protein